MISIMICIMLLPFALVALIVSFLIIAAIWFIITHGWTEFKTKYIDVDDA